MTIQIPHSNDVQTLAAAGSRTVLDMASNPEGSEQRYQALHIRVVEEELLELFGRKALHGAIHNFVGEELIDGTVESRLREHDFLTSNHRCDGHFITVTGNCRCLVDERIDNVGCLYASIGSSQQLYAPNFISKRQQGGLLPVGAGVTLDRKANHAVNGAAYRTYQQSPLQDETLC